MASVPRSLYTTQKEACLIAWFDYCAETDQDYEQTILREFQALVGKKQKVTYDKIISKIRNLLKSWGMNKVSVEDLRKKGTQCIAESDGLIPQEAASEMKTLRVMWDIGEFFKDTAVSDRHRGERSDTEFIGDDLSVS
jgi:hypothetical protein